MPSTPHGASRTATSQKLQPLWSSPNSPRFSPRMRFATRNSAPIGISQKRKMLCSAPSRCLQGSRRDLSSARLCRSKRMASGPRSSGLRSSLLPTHDQLVPASGASFRSGNLVTNAVCKNLKCVIATSRSLNRFWPLAISVPSKFWK